MISTSDPVVEDTVELVRQVLSTVDDPEYPGVSVLDLGLVESIEDDGSTVSVGLIPTMSGCPALVVIERDVRDALVSAVADREISVRFLNAPVWTPERISAKAASFLAREYSVAIRTRRHEPPCPTCGGVGLEPRSEFGPTPCRSVEWCPACRNPIEVVRR